jgi:hypothetical protein
MVDPRKHYRSGRIRRLQQKSPLHKAERFFASELSKLQDLGDAFGLDFLLGHEGLFRLDGRKFANPACLLH